MYKLCSDPDTLQRSLNAKRGVIARTIAFEVLKLPHVCEECGVNGQVQVHHINKDRDNNTRENLMILCRRCHNNAHGVTLPKKEKIIPEEMVIIDRRYKLKPKNHIIREKRRLATEAYKKKWGIPE